jgi:small subunit ribosomal protein S2
VCVYFLFLPRFIIMSTSSVFRALLNSGVHLGHHVSKSTPIMVDHYSRGLRNNRVLLDLEQTVLTLNTTARFMRKLRRKGGNVLFVCQNPKLEPLLACFHETVPAAAQKQQQGEGEGDGGVEKKPCDQFHFVQNWPAGLLTNWHALSEQREDVDYKLGKLAKSSQRKAALRQARFDGFFSGIKGLRERPDMLFLLPARGNRTVINEAIACNIPVAAICNSDADVSKIDYPVIGNDVSPRSVTLLVKLLGMGVREDGLADALDRMGRAEDGDEGAEGWHEGTNV